jgi:DNA-3-methyladenine glycosylase
MNAYTRSNAKTRVKKLTRAFYTRDAETLARELIGKILVRRLPDAATLRGRIVETEAYVGEHDLACHAAKGRTNRTEIMFGPGGHAYVYLIYGMHQMLNIVSGKAEDAQAVLIRAAEPMDGWETNLSGPGKLAREFRIMRADNGLDLTGNELFAVDDGYRPTVGASTRVGIDYAEDWKHALLRFYDINSEAVSKPRPTPTQGN